MQEQGGKRERQRSRRARNESTGAKLGEKIILLAGFLNA